VPEPLPVLTGVDAELELGVGDEVIQEVKDQQGDEDMFRTSLKHFEGLVVLNFSYIEKKARVVRSTWASTPR
jgi:hypothetical protein